MTEWTNIHDSKELNFTRLTWHCFKKGVQFGSVIGCAVITPIVLVRNHRRATPFCFRKILKYQAVGVGIGTFIGLGMMLGKYFSWENKEQCLQDRAYRIHKNEKQNRVDEITSIAFAASFLPALAFTRSIPLSVGFSAPFVCAGLLYHVLNPM